MATFLYLQEQTRLIWWEDKEAHYVLLQEKSIY